MNNIYSQMAAALTSLGVDNTPEKLAPFLALCKMFPEQAVNEAAHASLWKFHRRPFPADLADLLKEIIGEDRDSLLRRGCVSFRKLWAINDSTQDLICDDWRAVHAVKTAFGSLYEFFQDFEDLSWRQKRYSEAYASVDYLQQHTVCKEFLLTGNSKVSNESFRRARFLGDYDRCLQLLYSLPNAGEYRAPLDSRTAMKLAAPVPVVSEEERIKSKATLAQILRDLGMSDNAAISA